LGDVVLLWPIWALASPRSYPYGFIGFILTTVIGTIYVIIMIIIGILFLRSARTFRKRELNYLGLAILIVGICDTFHVIGDIFFYLTNDSRVPIDLDGFTLYYYPTATCLSTFGIILAYTLIYLFGAIQTRQRFTTIDRIVTILGIIGIGFGVNPYNWWHMIPPEGAMTTIPITGTFLLVMGILATYSLYRYYQVKLVAEMKVDAVGRLRLKLILAGIGFLGLLVALMMLHAILAVMGAKILMLIVTYFKIFSLVASVILLYLGVVAPSFILGRYRE